MAKWDENFFQEDEPLADVLAARDSGERFITVAPPAWRIAGTTWNPENKKRAIIVGDPIAISASGNSVRNTHGIVVPA